VVVERERGEEREGEKGRDIVREVRGKREKKIE
jgi:hypothetical protein